MQKVAVAIVHGIGRQKPDFAAATIAKLQKRLRKLLGDAAVADGFRFEPVYWAPALKGREDILWDRVCGPGRVGWRDLRGFMVNFVADAIAYQPIPGERDAYDDIHAIFAETLGRLAAGAGAKAPLCVIGHSLGTVISSNFLYDLQCDFRPGGPAASGLGWLTAPKVRAKMGGTALERGETLALFYTLGSPLALWSLRYEDFGRPIEVPSPQLARHYPGLEGEWVNFYDKADVIGYPLKELNGAYGGQVSSDSAVRVGGLLTFWNPLSHIEYLGDRRVLRPIAESLALVWRAVNS